MPEMTRDEWNVMKQVDGVKGPFHVFGLTFAAKVNGEVLKRADEKFRSLGRFSMIYRDQFLIFTGSRESSSGIPRGFSADWKAKMYVYHGSADRLHDAMALVADIAGEVFQYGPTTC